MISLIQIDSYTPSLAQEGQNVAMILPGDPSDLGPEWVPDPSHRDPNGQRFRDPRGRPLDFHEGRPGERGWKGKNHWHDNKGKDHLKPGDSIPDPGTVEPNEFSRFMGNLITDIFQINNSFADTAVRGPTPEGAIWAGGTVIIITAPEAAPVLVPIFGPVLLGP